jgi:predicted transcriptional regulator
MAILSAAQRPATLTQLMAVAQLNHRQVTTYLARLMASRLVLKHPARDVYQLTVKGRRYRRAYTAYQRLYALLSEDKATRKARKAALRRLVADP